jgi:hypothetical protein
MVKMLWFLAVQTVRNVLMEQLVDVQLVAQPIQCYLLAVDAIVLHSTIQLQIYV